MAAADLVAQLIEDLEPGCVVLKFVVVAEVISPDGRRTLWQATHDGATRWDTYGLLTEALEEVKAGHHSASWESELDEGRDED